MMRQLFWYLKEMKKGRNARSVVNGNILVHVNEVVYLGSMFSRNGRYEMDAERRIAAGNRANGALRTFDRTQCSVGTDAIIRQRNVDITDEE